MVNYRVNMWSFYCEGIAEKLATYRMSECVILYTVNRNVRPPYENALRACTTDSLILKK